VPGTTAAPDTLRADEISATKDRYYGGAVGVSIFRRSILYDVGGQYRFAHDVVGEETAPDRSADVRTFTVRAAVALLF
jgi:hypothetical protein